MNVKMFKEDRIYDIVMLEYQHGEGQVETTYSNCTVVEVKWPVVRFVQAGLAERIINLSSPSFVKAEPKD